MATTDGSALAMASATTVSSAATMSIGAGGWAGGGLGFTLCAPTGGSSSVSDMQASRKSQVISSPLSRVPGSPYLIISGSSPRGNPRFPDHSSSLCHRGWLLAAACCLLTVLEFRPNSEYSGGDACLVPRATGPAAGSSGYLGHPGGLLAQTQAGACFFSLLNRPTTSADHHGSSFPCGSLGIFVQPGRWEGRGFCSWG